MNVLGDYTVTYTATDGAGNTSTVTRLVKVVDRIAPEIEILGKNPFEHCRFKAYTDPGVKIKDNYYTNADLQSLLTVDMSEVILSSPGYYYVLYNVTDPSGNKAISIQRLIHVIEGGPCFTGIQELSTNNNLSIYPNPSKGLFTISNKTNTNIATVTVLDIVGKTVYTQAPQSKEVEVDLTQMNKGLYMVIIKDANGREFSAKVVVD